jgi:hypothetical protein
MSKISDEIMAMRVHFGFTDNQLKAGLVAAFAATFLATMFGEWFTAVGWPVAFSFNTLNAEVWATNFKNLSGFFAITKGQLLSADFTYFLGMWAHYSQGIIFGLLFTFLIYPNLPGGMGVGKNLLKGLLWGWTLFLVSSSFVMPLLYGTGFMFSVWGTFFPPNGQIQLIFQNFVWHSTFGFLLGVFYNPMPKPGAGMEMPGMKSMGSPAHWGQLVLGWVVVYIGGYISSSSTTAASWGIIVGIIGLILTTGPSFSGLRKKQ